MAQSIPAIKLKWGHFEAPETLHPNASHLNGTLQVVYPLDTLQCCQAPLPTHCKGGYRDKVHHLKCESATSKGALENFPTTGICQIPPHHLLLLPWSSSLEACQNHLKARTPSKIKSIKIVDGWDHASPSHEYSSGDWVVLRGVRTWVLALQSLTAPDLGIWHFTSSAKWTSQLS